MTDRDQQRLDPISLSPLENDSEPDSELKISRFQLPSFPRFISFLSTYSIVFTELFLGLLVGFVFMLLGLGAGASILSGITTGALVSYTYRVLYEIEIKPNKNARKMGQAIVGLSIGISLAHSHLVETLFHLPILIFTTLFLLLCSFLIGYIYSRISQMDFLTAMLAVVPGNIGIMASIAADYGRNVSVVSLVQLIRFTSIILLVPLISQLSTPHDFNAIVSSITTDLLNSNFISLMLLVLVLAITLFASSLGSQLKIPAAYLFCSIVVGIVFNALLSWLPFVPHLNFSLPNSINLVGQTLLGITIGEYWGINPILRKRTVALASIPVLMIFLAGFIAAGMLMLITHWDWLTCLLVASPGGSPEMILIALVLQQNVEIVTAAHLVRLIAINIYLPIMILILEKYGMDKVETQTITS
jgi:hypothetical protein